MKPGDIVIGISNYDGKAEIINNQGIIVSPFNNSTTIVSVAYFEKMGGHNCGGLVKDGNGWNTGKTSLRLPKDWEERMDIINKHRAEYEQAKSWVKP